MAGEVPPLDVHRFDRGGPVPVLECDELPPPAALRRALRRARPRQVMAVEATPPAGFARRAAIFLIHLYQRHLSERLARRCLLEPSCSRYAELAVAQNGVWRGTLETWRRLHRCQPDNEGTIDYPEGVRICPTKSSQSDESSTTSHARS